MEDLATRQLQQLLNAKNQFPEIVLLKTTTTSTNDDMREIAQKGMTTGLVCSAQQTQGRGLHQLRGHGPGVDQRKMQFLAFPNRLRHIDENACHDRFHGRAARAASGLPAQPELRARSAVFALFPRNHGATTPRCADCG